MNRRPHDMLGRRNEQLVEGFCVQTWHEGERDAQGGRRNVQLAGTEGMEWVSQATLHQPGGTGGSKGRGAPS